MNHLSIPLQYRFVQEKGNIVSDMDGDKVMMNIHNGKYYNLGQIGGRIWELIAEPASAPEIVAVLMKEYDVEQAVCEEHVGAFLKHLMDEKLVHVGEKL
ncbi:lasso peptide biosynthesis PqqD family chaperone [Bacillus sp. 3255]|uniref:lasso peptide biosynthesis PqqD family chaperone n=1 Tax=Bacillus sp. 3255 TaxID=2817904 RepID=UPI0028556738|nr:lasso peptide biosynthesis PqqD family chaperone [Bacillus sp. 3255]MDR6878665.1 hypothetical protein [Bacillus sp. 3255]